MKGIVLLVVFVPVMAHGQIIENFESASVENWTESTAGHWIADSSQSLSGGYSLHHVFDNTLSGSDCIGIPLTNLHPDEGLIKWRFMIRHGYDPSASNNWAVYLMSDTDPVSLPSEQKSNGFIVGVNLTGYDDTLRIWKIRDGSVSVVVKCPVNWQNDIGINAISIISVERTETGLWNISVLDSDSNLRCWAEGSDPELCKASWFLVNYRYTSTRDRLLWFDDLEINGVFYKDTIPPLITGCTVTGRRSLEIITDEELADKNMIAENYIPEDNNIHVTSIRKNSENIYTLQFSGNLNNKVANSLLIRDICDKVDNCNNDVRVYFTPVWVEAGDVLFTEIMADPIPEVNLPGKEYLEITNRTQYTFNTKNWIFRNGDQTISLPSGIIGPGEYIIFCSLSDTSLFSKYGKTTGLKPFPVLTDVGKLIALSDSLGYLIHGLEYSSGWYSDKLKEDGGWALEIIDINYPFFSDGNWEASISNTGGTPGLENSVARTNPDNCFKGILNVFPYDTISFDLWLSETIFDLENNVQNILIDHVPADSVEVVDPLYQHFRIKAKTPFETEQVYTLHLSPLMLDFSGNPIIDNISCFGIPARAKAGDIVFNELLFYPYPDDPDYIELYNCSDRVIDVSRLYLASIDESGDTSTIKVIGEESRCFLPWSFYVVTTDRESVLNRYLSSDEKTVFNTHSLPSMPNDRGHLILLNRELDLIDEVLYSEEMHYSLLADNRGISLEKIRPQAASSESMNWHSASESAGWGTPGRENSVFSRGIQTDDRITLSSDRITPDNDGYEDLLVIDLNLEGNGNVVTVTIFNETGNYVKRIAENLFAGSRAAIVWDGTADDGNIVSTGIYIFLIELYNDKGKTKLWKKICTVIKN